MNYDSLYIAHPTMWLNQVVPINPYWLKNDTTCLIASPVPSHPVVGETGFEGIKPESGLFSYDVSSGIFLLITIVYCFVLLRSNMFVNITLKSIFGRNRERNSIFEPEITASEARYGLFMRLLGFAGLSAYLYIWSARYIPVSGQYGSLILLGGTVAGMVVFLLFKYVIFALLSYTFFGKNRYASFAKHYLSVIFGAGVILLPLTVIRSFVQPELVLLIDNVSIIVCIIAVLLLMYKILQFFERSYYSIFYIILYLCTLEILPLLVVVKLLQNVSIVV
jgi:hypothetical protein